MVQTDRYFLHVGEAGRPRLEILNGLYNPSTQAFALASGLTAGMRVLEIGCGVGAMSAWLAKQAGPSGGVTTIDQSDAQLAIATERAAAEHVTVDFRRMPVADLGALGEKFDFVICRWVLLHLRDPAAAVASMVDLLQPGGVLMLEDCVTSSAFAQPAPPAFDRFIQGWLTISAAQGMDPLIGEKLPGLLHEARVPVARYAVFQPLLVDDEDRRVIPMCVRETRAAHVEFGAMHDALIDTTIQELEDLARSSVPLGFVRNHMVSGRTS